MAKQPKLQFPKKFLWGAATAAHQVEGGLHNQWSVSELEMAKTRAQQAEYQLRDLENWPDIKSAAKNPDNYVSGSAVDHRHHYEEDFDTLASLNLNAFRFSVEWSRLEPKEGGWDAEAITWYREYIAALKKRNIEPVMTLLHFTLPVWFVEKGGFEKRANVKYFVRFAEKVMAEIGKDVRYVITINEPEVYAGESYFNAEWPPAKSSRWLYFKVLNNQIRAHNKAAKAIHALSRRHKVSIAKNSPYVYPGDDAWLSRVSAAVIQYVLDDYVLKRVIKQCDFIGVNYYFSNRVYGYRIHNPNVELSDMGWDLAPENIQFVLERLAQKYKKPILVTENGLADARDTRRKQWLAKTIMAMSEAMRHDVKLIGYLHWSLIDNFEWAKGKWPRFGLVAYDYEKHTRTVRPSAKWYGAVVKKIRASSEKPASRRR